MLRPGGAAFKVAKKVVPFLKKKNKQIRSFRSKSPERVEDEQIRENESLSLGQTKGKKK